LRRAWSRWPASATPYPVVVGHGEVALWEANYAPLRAASSVHVVVDATVAGACGDLVARLGARLREVPHVVHEAPAGEASKSLAAYERLVEALLAAGIDRHAHLIAVGGGAVSDAVGFAAATLMRGISWSIVPTTLLAMIDAALGGKTALDTAAGKNTIGAFWQPRGVWADLDVLATLPARERRSAFGEFLKYGLLVGEDLLVEVEAHAAWAEGGGVPPAGLAELVHRAARYKCHVVSLDERERTQRRVLLNLGHTLGHAIEHAGHGGVAHGEAVGLGLLAAARVSHAVGIAGQDHAPRIARALAACGLAHDLAPWLSPDVLAYISADKKRRGATVDFVAMRDVGACEVVNLPLREVDRILRAAAN